MAQRKSGRELERMDMTGEYRIPAPRQRVWEALNDPAILKAAIPGCEELNKVSDNELEARVKAKVGPVSATFTGKVTLNDLNPPASYRIAGEGKGGAAGYAKGGAEVNLAEDGSDTILRYAAKADVGGKLAQIGSRLIQGTAKKMADDFFGKFSTIVADRYTAEAPTLAPATPPPVPESAPAAAAMDAAATGVLTPPPAAPRQVAFQPERAAAPTAPKVPAPTAKSGQPWYVWLIGAIILVIILFWLL
jgi:carbon monoxide dehydrogenase subunit G